MRFLRPLWFLFLFVCVDGLALAWVRRGKGSGVLVIKNGALGDYLLFRNFLEPLRRHPAFQGATIFLAGPASARELGEAFDRETVDVFNWIDYDRFLRNPLYRFGILRRIKRTGFRTALASGHNREFMWDDALVRASGAAERIGRQAVFLPGRRPSLLLRWGNGFYTRLLPGEPEPCFEFLQNAAFFRAVLGEAPLPSSPRLTPVPVDLPELPPRFALFFPGTRSRLREWPVDRFAKLAEALWRERGLEIVLAGMSWDHERARRIREEAAAVPFRDLTGKLSQLQLAAVVARAALVVGGDSGGIHLAAAVGVPGVGISKGSFLGRFHPYPASVAPFIRFVYPPPLHGAPEGFIGRPEFRGGASPFSIEEVTLESVLAAARSLLP